MSEIKRVILDIDSAPIAVQGRHLKKYIRHRQLYVPREYHENLCGVCGRYMTDKLEYYGEFFCVQCVKKMRCD